MSEWNAAAEVCRSDGGLSTIYVAAVSLRASERADGRTLNLPENLSNKIPARPCRAPSTSRYASTSLM